MPLLEPLLWVSEVRFDDSSTRQFAVTIGRSSVTQRFGILLHAQSDGKIVVAEDAQQFGIVKGDLLLGINGCSKSLTEEKCRSILNSALRIDLNLLRMHFDAHNNQSKNLAIDNNSSWSDRYGYRCIDLLAAGAPQSLAASENQFTVQMLRTSRHQKFGLDLRSVNSDATGRKVTCEIFCAEDMPHLGLEKDDQILSLNGTKGEFSECRSILDTCMSIQLLVKRQHRTPNQRAIVDEEAKTEEKPVGEPKAEEQPVEDPQLEDCSDWMVLEDDELPLCIPKRSLL
jgi:hypothetical protein